VSVLPLAVNAAWLAQSWPALRRFKAQTGAMEAVQRARLAGYLQANRDTEFGRAHGFASIGSWEAYRDRVPVQSYEGFAPYVARIAEGRPQMLTAEPVRKFEPTAGSSGPEKWIPYTATLHREFRRGIAAWLAALFLEDRALMDGRSYWSLTPRLAPRERTSVVPVGFEDDREYLGGAMGWLLGQTLVVHPALRDTADMDAFWRLTLLLLLRARDLRLISAWSPTFLELLADRLAAGWPDLLRTLRDGDAIIPADPARAAALEALGPDDLARIWPGLRLISCWTDAASASAATRLPARFPGVRIQPKGLVATEALVTLPLGARRVLAYDCHVYEFLDAHGVAHPPWALEVSGEYAIVVTTGGGLYRYALGDLVRVDAIENGLPALTFLGKAGAVSDRVGEKLAEPLVAQCLSAAFATHSLAPRFAMLAYEPGEGQGSYALFLDAEHVPDALAPDLDAALRANPYYDEARALGQLGALTVVRVTDGAGGYSARLVADGMQLGAIKPAALSRQDGWRAWFEGRR
jgi:hypothetical protein